MARSPSGIPNAVDAGARLPFLVEQPRGNIPRTIDHAPDFDVIVTVYINLNDHEFHFRSLLLGDQLSLEAFELVGDDEAGGYRLQILGEADSEPFALLRQLIQKMKRALSMEHLQADTGRLQITDMTVRGRIVWNDLGAMLLAFEG